MAGPCLRVGEAPTGILQHLLTLSSRQMRKVVAYFRYQVSTDVDLFRVLYKNIIDKLSYCELVLVNFVMEKKAKKLNCLSSY